MFGQATNADLANRLYASPEVSGSGRFSKPKLSQTGFAIEHYAGPVTYKTDNFLAKNRDFVVAEHQVLLQASSEAFVQVLFPSEPEANGNTVRAPIPPSVLSCLLLACTHAGLLHITWHWHTVYCFDSPSITDCACGAAEQGWSGIQVLVGGQPVQAPAAGPDGRSAQDGAPLHPLHQAQQL